MKILFRADGNSSIGLGHLYRLFSLVEIYKKKYDFVFLTKSNSEVSVIPDNYSIKLIPLEISYNKEPEWIKSNFDSENYIMIADGYQFKSEYQKKIKGQSIKLIYIDDLVQWHMYADFVINHSQGISKDDYLKENYTKFALGTKYSLLRPSFLNLAKKKRKIKIIKTIFICFGGADPHGLTIKAIRACLSFDRIIKINVVIGAAFKYKDLLIELEKEDSRIKVNLNLSEEELINLMRDSDFALVPSSTVLYELCSVKMPILSGFYVNNQKKIYTGFLSRKAIFGLGDISNFQPYDFKEAINNFFTGNNFNKYCEIQGSLFDGKIEQRFLDIIEEIVC